MRIHLEHNFNDILGKACCGLGLADEELARRIGLYAATVTAVKDAVLSTSSAF